ncbi:MAG: Glucosamine-phosphate N-acetyltransferase-like protein [Chrysothrix sp. TS-e1954]|nr:MAG: Glucosamine-phosphate N-acetyltransferase-like protein [Chrysothrix sp. TS-e1954]
MTINTTTAPTPLFSPSTIPTSIPPLLPAGYTIRPLLSSDAHSNFLPVLTVLTTVGDISPSAFAAQFAAMRACADTYYTLVICDAGARVVGTGSVVVERKWIHGAGKVGHVEDIAVERGQQGMKLGLRIIQALTEMAGELGCYKTILDCSEANEGFYVKCGYKRAGLEMACYYEKKE